ncbi:MAG: 50S ribosomal protein L1 [Deltaproteobacteria bacterium]|nr:50S ribosomal protein L1 [Deltaproteobacteria bacterium]
MARGKSYRSIAERIERERSYTFREGLELLSASKRAKFDETAEVAFNLSVDPRHADQNVRGAVSLPHGTGKSARVIVFAKGEKEREAREAGADAVGGDDLAAKINEGWLDFDRVLATPDMMGVVGKLGRVLGPRGLMPNPKVGTVTQDIGRAVAEQKAGKIEFRVDKNGIVHAPFGKLSFTSEQLGANLLSITEAIVRAKPASAKGVYMKKVSISSTMGPGIRIDPADLQAQLAS